MKNLTVMIKPASSLCNLRCKYCFYADVSSAREIRSFGVMKDDVTEKVLSNIKKDLEPGDNITFAFQGGEPTLAGLAYFRHFSSLLDAWEKDITAHYVIQTNATLLNDEWCEYLHEYQYLVGVSMDLLSENHDRVRVDEKGRGTFRPVKEAIRLLEKHGVEYNVLCTLTNQTARHPQAVWKEILKQDLKYVQFTPCLDDLDSDKPSPFALTPRRFADFYITIFSLWLEALKKGDYRSVKLFDDVVGYLATGMPSTCDVAGHCSPQFIVEADGSVYPCDFYCTDEYRLGYITEQTLIPLRDSPEMAAFLNRPHTQPTLCAECRYRNFCGGGCKRMQKQVCCEPDADFCGYQAFLDACMPVLLQLAEQEKAYRK